MGLVKLKQKNNKGFANAKPFVVHMVPEARVELARLATTVFETAASAIPPLGHASSAL